MVLEGRIEEIKLLQEKRNELLSRMQVIQELQGNRPVIVRLFDELARKLAERVFYTEIEIVGKSRKMEIAEARQVSMYLCRKIIGTSLNNIGVFFGGRDHSTVIHAVKTIDEKLTKKAYIKKQIDTIKQELDFSLP